MKVKFKIRNRPSFLQLAVSTLLSIIKHIIRYKVISTDLQVY